MSMHFSGARKMPSAFVAGPRRRSGSHNGGFRDRPWCTWGWGLELKIKSTMLARRTLNVSYEKRNKYMYRQEVKGSVHKQSGKAWSPAILSMPFWAFFKTFFRTPKGIFLV